MSCYFNFGSKELKWHKNMKKIEGFRYTVSGVGKMGIYFCVHSNSTK